jgi:hypothetical protein
MAVLHELDEVAIDGIGAIVHREISVSALVIRVKKCTDLLSVIASDTNENSAGENLWPLTSRLII